MKNRSVSEHWISRLQKRILKGEVVISFDFSREANKKNNTYRPMANKIKMLLHSQSNNLLINLLNR